MRWNLLFGLPLMASMFTMAQTSDASKPPYPATTPHYGIPLPRYAEPMESADRKINEAFIRLDELIYSIEHRTASADHPREIIHISPAEKPQAALKVKLMDELLKSLRNQNQRIVDAPLEKEIQHTMDDLKKQMEKDAR